MFKAFLEQVALSSVHQKGVELELRKPVVLFRRVIHRLLGVTEAEDVC